MNLEAVAMKDFDIRGADIRPKETDSKSFDKRIDTATLKNDVIDGIPHRIDNFDDPTPVYMRNQSLENSVHPVTLVPFEKRIVQTPSREVVAVVVPKFDAIFKAVIPEELYLKDNKEQFKACNEQLLKKIESDPEFKKQFTDEQIEQIRDGIEDGSAPDGYVWHHEPESGELSLVDSKTHANTGHTGGGFLWSGGSVFSFKYGENKV